ncbi:hypothetical protein Tco_0172531 [Tanacetum coccineum]
MLDKKELSIILDDLRTIFHLPQANDNNHNSFVPPPSFSDMVPFYKQQLGFTMELKTSSSFKTTGLLQPWQTLCKIFSKCLTTRVTGWDQPPLQIMQMMYCFVNNIHVDYAELLWEGIYYSLHHPTSSIPYLRFTKDHHWMITEEMKHTKHYRMYAEVFGLDVPLNQSQPTESTQGTHRTHSAPSVQSTLKRIQQSQVLQNDLYEMILQDTLQVSLAEHKSREEQEARENVELVNKHLASEEIEKLEPRSDKESPEVKSTNDEEVEVTKVVIPVNVNEEEDEITDKVSPRSHTNLVSSDTKKLQELKKSNGQNHYLLGDTHIKEQVEKQFLRRSEIKFPVPSAIRPRDQDNPDDDAHPKGENSAKRQNTSEYEAYVSRESSSRRVNERNEVLQLQVIKSKKMIMIFGLILLLQMMMKYRQVSQDIMEEVSLTIDEAKLKKMVDEMLRQICALGDEHQYHIDQMKNFLQSDIVWESRKEILGLSSSRKTHHLSFNASRDLGSSSTISDKSRPFIVARRANECIVSITEPDYKNLNKNDIEDMYLLIMNGKVPDYAETWLLWSLLVFIRSSVIWERVHDFQLGIESYQQKVNLTAPIMSFPRVEKHIMFSIIYEPVHGIIYKNSKKEKRVMRHSEIHKFCDATLNRVLEGLKSYNNDVKYGYVQRELTNDEVEYLKLFEEEIEVRLKHRNQMRRWEMYVNGRPLGPRRERPE